MMFFGVYELEGDYFVILSYTHNEVGEYILEEDEAIEDFLSDSFIYEAYPCIYQASKEDYDSLEELIDTLQGCAKLNYSEELSKTAEQQAKE